MTLIFAPNTCWRSKPCLVWPVACSRARRLPWWHQNASRGGGCCCG